MLRTTEWHLSARQPGQHTPTPHPPCATRMQALLDEWRSELARKPLGMSEADACAVLQVELGPEGGLQEEELKQVWRSPG